MRHTRRRASVLAIAATMAGCASDGNLVLAPPAPDVPASRRLGDLVLAKGALGFAPCDERVGPVFDGTPGAELASAVRGMQSGQDGAVFVDVEAARGTDGRWRIDRLRRMYRDGPRCRESGQSYVWRAEGNGPAWSLESSPRYLSVRREGRADVDRFRFRPFVRTTDGAWTFSGQADGAAVNVVLRPIRCRAADGLLLTEWSVSLTLRGETLTGCAWNGTVP